MVGDVAREGGLEVIFDSNRPTRVFVFWSGVHRRPERRDTGRVRFVRIADGIRS